MDRQATQQRVTAIIPAYNEATRLGSVLDVVTSYPFHEVIVVDDGSTDATGEVARRYPVRLIRQERNGGKGKAMDTAVRAATTDTIFFSDADIKGLNHQMIDEIIAPVLDGQVEMFIGMRNRKLYFLHAIMIFIPLLGGERAMTKALWQKLPDYYKHYFRIEVGLNFYAQYYSRGFGYKVFPGLSQVIKEKKYGLAEGLRQRYRLYANVVSAQLKLQLIDLPPDHKARRRTVIMTLQSVAGLALGAVLVAAAYVGPLSFFTNLFAEELREDPSAPLAHLLIYWASRVSGHAVWWVGGLLVAINFFSLLLFLRRLRQLYSADHH